MSKLTTTLMTTAILSCVGFAAQSQASDIEADGYAVSANVTLATDYRFRGISQLSRSPAIQGGFDVEFANGLYAGVWGSNVNFTDGAVELDYYGGYATELANGVSIDVGVIYYNYPHGPSGDLDYVEFHGAASYGGVSVALDYSPDYFDGTGTFFYPSAGYDVDLLEKLNLALHVGYNALDDDRFLGSDEAYLDWSVGLSTHQLGLDWAVSYIDTDISRADCFGGDPLCKATAVLSVSKSL